MGQLDHCRQDAKPLLLLISIRPERRAPQQQAPPQQLARGTERIFQHAPRPRVRNRAGGNFPDKIPHLIDRRLFRRNADLFRRHALSPLLFVL